MTISSVREADTRSAEWQDALATRLGVRVEVCERLSPGRNSQVYRLTCADGRRYAVKRYFRHSSDGRDRLTAEFGAFRFLWAQGVTCVPEPIAAEPSLGLAVYEYVEGKRLEGPDVHEREIDEAVEFLVGLRALRSRAGADQLPPASEACLSLADFVANMTQRLGRLGAVASTGTAPELAVFLSKRYRPAWRMVLDRLEVWCRETGRDSASPLDARERTLSPSDFGFHNMLQRDGRLIFLDFEYFGWDDPAKLLSDVLLHPGMTVAEPLRQRFVAQALPALDSTGGLPARLKALFPLCGLKWCLILLNEFVARDQMRREFAEGAPEDRRTVLAGQLAKANRMLTQVMERDE